MQNKTLKVMSIISLVITVLALLCLLSFDTYTDYSSAIGWGDLLALWSIAFSITVLVQSKNKEIK